MKILLLVTSLVFVAAAAFAQKPTDSLSKMKKDPFVLKMGNDSSYVMPVKIPNAYRKGSFRNAPMPVHRLKRDSVMVPGRK